MRFFLIALAATVCPAQQSWPYLTYFGGVGSENIRFVSSDGAGGTIVAGDTSSVGPPFTEQQPGWRSVSSAFVAKFDASGRLGFVNILGDGGVAAMAADADGNIFLAGTIRAAADFTTPGVFQRETAGVQAFVAKFSSSGEKLFATYFGSQSAVQISSLTLDRYGQPIFCGWAVSSAAVPLTSSTLYTSEGRNPAAFCSQLSSDGATLIFSTLLGKPSTALSNGTFPFSAALDEEGNIVVAGTTSSDEFRLSIAPQSVDRRRSLYSSQNGEAYQSTGGTRLGSVASVQRVGNDVFVGTVSNGAWVSTDSGDTWRQIAGSPSGPLVIHPSAPRFQCVSFTNQAMCSRDGGASWHFQFFGAIGISLVPDPRVDGGFFVTANQRSGLFEYLALGAAAPTTNLSTIPRWLSINSTGDRVLAIVSDSLMLSEDRGVTFRKLSENLSRVAESPSAPNVLFATRALRFPERDSLIVRSDDGGSTWRDTSLNIPFSFLRDLVVDPADSNVVYAVAGAGAYRSADGGLSWELWTPPGLDNIAVQALHFDARNRVWVGAAVGGNGFFLRLNIDNPAISRGAIFGGAGGGSVNKIRIDGTGRIWFAGSTSGLDVAVTGDDLAPRSFGGGGVIGRYEPLGEIGTLRYVGVTPNDFDIAADGALHVAATMTPANIGAAGEMRGRFGGGESDAVWLVISPELDRVVRAAWLGGSGTDTAAAISAGRDGNVRLVGSTVSRNLPVSADALQREFTLFGGQQQIGNEGFLAIAPQ